MAGHADRDHALLSPSSAHRWTTCTASALLEKDFPDTTSDAAREGTLAHELAEGTLLRRMCPKKYSAQKLTALKRKCKASELWDDEMIRTTEFYADAVYQRAMAFPCNPSVWVEESVDLTDYIPDGFGTADCILAGGDTMHVIDYKHGKGVRVEAERNPQLQLYALGALKVAGLFYPIQRVRITIVQPRIDHVSDWELSVDALKEFGETAGKAAKEALSGSGKFVPSDDACRFCKAREACRARHDKILADAFGIERGKPPLITPEEAGDYIRKLTDVEGCLKDLKAWALAQCLDGHEVPGFKAVAGRNKRDWTDADEARKAIIASGIDEALLWERKPLTLAQTEKLMGKKSFNEVAGAYVNTVPGAPTLVPASDKREAITNNRTTAKEAFQN